MPIKIYRKNIVANSDSGQIKRFAEIEADVAELEKEGWRMLNVAFTGQFMLVFLHKPAA